ncbi:hypothetical protein ADIARSV_1994 [Arcticibacter svalbardensis MN12-7]|uniref:Uncharacterized protein n=1 Tax=Arcticibacter svalbardensis MN12-7 TaxID=1150600 RepID=R9GSX1_9SPHI|nr:hypothetical protein ADIARSV_1994 [Arcticibacter svalbardensis MN12-7]
MEADKLSLKSALKKQRPAFAGLPLLKLQPLGSFMQRDSAL